MNLNSSLNNCLYRILQCEGKEIEICDMIFSKCYIVCSIQGIEVVVTDGRIFFFSGLEQ
jgi:hypothetical protein